MRGNRVRAVVLLTAVAWLAVTFFAETPSSRAEIVELGRAVARFSTALTVAVLAATIYEKWLWKLPVFRGWLTSVPDIEGVWRVELVSTFRPPGSAAPLPPIRAYMQVTQSETDLSTRLYTPESYSRVVAHSFTRSGDDFELAATYRNDPDIALQLDRSRPHAGAFVLRGHGFRPQRLAGTYWTDRQTAGSMTLTDRRRGAIDSYAAAERLFGDS